MQSMAQAFFKKFDADHPRKEGTSKAAHYEARNKALAEFEKELRPLLEAQARQNNKRAAKDVHDSDPVAVETTRVVTSLKKAGFKKGKTSKSGSMYFEAPLPNGKTYRVRVSDHKVPETDERAAIAKSGGFSWANSGSEIVIGENFDSDDINEEMASIIKDYEKAKQKTSDEYKRLTNTEVEKYAADIADRLREKYKGGKEGWITMGAKGSPKHGGSPVKVDAKGKIVAGASGLVGQKVGQIKPKEKEDNTFDAPTKAKQKEGARKQATGRLDYNALYRQNTLEEAKRVGVPKERLRAIVEELHREKLEWTEKREKAKVELREQMTITAAKLAQIAKSGGDWTKIPKFDVLARRAAIEYPEIGLIDDPEQLFDFLVEGRVLPTPKHDTDLIREAANIAVEEKAWLKKEKDRPKEAWETEEFKKPGRPEKTEKK